MKKLKEVFRLKFEFGYSNRQIATSVNISPGTVSEYVSLFRVAGLQWSDVESKDDISLERLVYRLHLYQHRLYDHSRTGPKLGLSYRKRV